MVRNYLFMVIGALTFAYGVFCMIKGGTHVKNVGGDQKKNILNHFILAWFCIF